MQNCISKFDPAYDQKSLAYRFQKHVTQKEFFEKASRVLIACSGGPDSIALFHLTRLAFPNLKIALAHFNHGIRARTAKRDELFVKKLAEHYQIPFFLGSAKLSEKSARGKLSLEEAARQKRYAFLKQAYRKWRGNAIFFAHHLDDQAETVLMRMCQGTGMRGLLGIREQMIFDDMCVIRPLLAFSKAEMLGFLKQNQFSFCRDETNASTDYLRNRIRLEVLPFLEKKINPRVTHALARIPETIGVEMDFIAGLEREALKKVLVSNAKGKLVLRTSSFKLLHPALQFRVLDSLLKKIDPAAGLLFESGVLIREALKKPRFVLSLPRGLKLVGDKKNISIEKI